MNYAKKECVYPNIELPEDEEREEGLWQRVGEYWWLGLDRVGDSKAGPGYTTRTASSSRLQKTVITPGLPPSCHM